LRESLSADRHDPPDATAARAGSTLTDLRKFPNRLLTCFPRRFHLSLRQAAHEMRRKWRIFDHSSSGAASDWQRTLAIGLFNGLSTSLIQK
ncbi:MAG: hypothetical protein M3Y41_10165, partial [Pseudomonadota bacterium]|nr:hypothetical protein [Pseudomonadota bacterium]